jgi:hypothetical protein
VILPPLVFPEYVYASHLPGHVLATPLKVGVATAGRVATLGLRLIVATFGILAGGSKSKPGSCWRKGALLETQTTITTTSNSTPFGQKPFGRQAFNLQSYDPVIWSRSTCQKVSFFNCFTVRMSDKCLSDRWF